MKIHPYIFFILLLLIAIWPDSCKADEDKPDPSTWKKDGQKEIWQVWKDGSAEKCNPYWDGRGFPPCGVGYWYYFDQHPEWYPEVFPPRPKLKEFPHEYMDDPKEAQPIPEPSSLSMLGLGLLFSFKRKQVS